MNTNTKDLEKKLKALANTRRLAILKYLKQKNRTFVGDISRQIKTSIKATSKHLAILFAADIVDREQTGAFIAYSLSDNQNAVVEKVLDLI